MEVSLKESQIWKKVNVSDEKDEKAGNGGGGEKGEGKLYKIEKFG